MKKLVLAFSLSLTSLMAGTYYLSAGSDGNDANNGTTSSTPWKTIEHAMEQTALITNALQYPSSATDTLILKNGTYNEKGIDIVSQGHYIISSESGDSSKVIITRDGLDETGTNHYLFAKNNSSLSGKVIFNNVTIKGYKGHTSGNSRGGVIFHNVDLHSSSNPAFGYVTFNNCEFVGDSASRGSLTYGVNEVWVNNSHVEGGSAYYLITGGTYSRIKNSTLDYANSVFDGSMISSFAKSNTNEYHFMDVLIENSNISGHRGSVVSNAEAEVNGSVFDDCEMILNGVEIQDFTGTTVKNSLDEVFRSVTRAYSTGTPIRQCVFSNNNGLITGINDVIFYESLIEGTGGSRSPQYDSGYIEFKNCTVFPKSGDTNPIASADSIIIANSVFLADFRTPTKAASATNSILLGSEKGFLDSASQNSSSVFFDLDPRFTDTASGDYSVPAFSVTAQYRMGHVFTAFDTDAEIEQVGPAIINFMEDEIIYGSIKFKNSGATSDLFVGGFANSFYQTQQQLTPLSCSHENEYIKPGDTCEVFYKFDRNYLGSSNIENVNGVILAVLNDEDGRDSRGGVIYGQPDSLKLSFEYTNTHFSDNFPNYWDKGTVGKGVTTTDTFELVNKGTNYITITNMTESHTDLSGLALVDSTFPVTINPGASVKVTATFTGATVGDYVIPVTLYTQNVLNGEITSIEYRATVVDPTLSISPTSVTLNYGLVGEGSSVDSTTRNVQNSNSYGVHIDSVTVDNDNFTVLNKYADTVIDANSSFPLNVRFSPKTSGATVQGNCIVWYHGKQLKLPLSGTGVKTALVLDSSVLDFGRIGINTTKLDSIILTNDGSENISVTSLFSSDDAFEVLGQSSFEIAPAASVVVYVKFKPINPLGGDYSGFIQINYSDVTGSKPALKVSLAGSCAGGPSVAIDSILGDSIHWDSVSTVNFYSTAQDSDVVGTREVTYLWTSNGDSIAGQEDPSVKASLLGIGTHEIYLRVTDNEGDTALAGPDTITILSPKPYAKVLSVTPASIIIRDENTVELKLSAYDLDEFATEEADSLKSVQWYSTLSGAIEGLTTKSETVAGSSLELGLHGFYALVVDDEGDTASSDTVFVPVQNSMGRAILVTGTSFGDTKYFFNNISSNANIAYKRLRDRGFSDDQIYYMNHVGWQSLDGDPMTNSGIVDETNLTNENLKAHIQSLAPEIQKDMPLIIYLLGHGNAAQMEAKFYLNDTDYVSPAVLNEWLNELGDLSDKVSNITIILDFCFSGGFQNDLQAAEESTAGAGLSRAATTTPVKQKRVVVSSSDDKNYAYFSGGRSFATTIFDETYRGQSLKNCFETAKEWSTLNAPGENFANPQINANGNAEMNEPEDLQIASTIYLGGSQELQGLIAEFDVISASLEGNGVTLSTTVKGDVGGVRARVINPKFDLATGDVSALPVVDLLYNSDSEAWEANYNGDMSEVGDYLFMIEGEDISGNSMLSQGVIVDNAAVALSLKKLPMKLSFTPTLISGTTHLKFSLPQASDVKIDIYDLRGRIVKQIAKSQLAAGYYSIPLNGNTLGAGFYITHFVGGGKEFTKKMLLQR